MKKNYKVNLTMKFVYDLYKSKVFMAEFEEILGTDSESFDLFNANKGA